MGKIERINLVSTISANKSTRFKVDGLILNIKEEGQAEKPVKSILMVSPRIKQGDNAEIYKQYSIGGGSKEINAVDGRAFLLTGKAIANPTAKQVVEATARLADAAEAEKLTLARAAAAKDPETRAAIDLAVQQILSGKRLVEQK